MSDTSHISSLPDHTQSVAPQSESGRGYNWRNGLKKRLPFYFGAALLGIVALAYIDAGEEPLHPIVQSVAFPSAGDAQ